MDTSLTNPDARPSSLPALRLGALGRRHVDYRAVAALAAPLFLNSGVQAVLNLTDTWFLGRISTDATAAVGAVYWFVIVLLLLLGGVGIAVQTLVAQACGAGRRREAAQTAWSGLWVALLMTPLFLLAGLGGARLLAPFGLAPNVEALALAYWFPRMSGAVAGVALWAVSSFFNGIGRTRVTLGLMLAVVAASGCGLKGPLYLPEKSDVTIRPAPAATAPEAPAEQVPSTEPAPEPAPKQEQPPQDPKAGTDRG